MSETAVELKARLMAEAEAAIEKLLAERKPAAVASLADIEKVVRQAGLQFEQALTAELTAASGDTLPEWPQCPKCGRKMKNKGKRQRRIVTETGEIEVGRDYYHCANCHQGFFPPG